MTTTRRRLHPPPPPAPSATGVDVGQVVKRCDELDGAPLEREAEVLRALAGGPVVELVGCRTSHGRVELVTQRAGTSTLSDADHLPPRTVLRASAAACRAVVELHRSGWGHGSLGPDHVVVGGRGRATLCSLGQARPLVAAPDLVTTDREDLCAALLTVADLLGRRSADRVARRAAALLRSAAGSADDDLLEVAAQVEAGLDRLTERRGSRRTVRSGLLLAALACVLAVGAVLWPAAPTGHQLRTARATSPDSTPPTTALRVADGAVRAGAPGDASVVVDLDCDGDDEVMVLRPSTGELFIAPRLPHDSRNVRAVPAGVLPGAVGLTTTTSTDGCATPLATMPDGSTSPVDLGAAPPPATDPVAVPTAPAPVAAGPSTTTARTPPAPAAAATGRVAAPRPPAPTARPRTERPAPTPTTQAPPPAPPTTDPPFEYPVSDVPDVDPEPEEQPS